MDAPTHTMALIARIERVPQSSPYMCLSDMPIRIESTIPPTKPTVVVRGQIMASVSGIKIDVFRA